MPIYRRTLPGKGAKSVRLARRFRIGRHLALSLIFLLPVGAVIAVPGTAYACNSEATGSWSNNCTVSSGSISNLVVGVQQYINGFGSCGQLTVDGDFGNLTYQAVKCYQFDMGISNDGIVGPITWGTMQSHLRKAAQSGDWQYYSSYPVADNFREWIPSGAWYTRNASGTWVRM
jgi:peptidoglycan hydrolase-like protein with peptidoglycan-binding domain